MPEGGQIPPGPRMAQDRRERLLMELAQHLREMADICEALTEPDIVTAESGGTGNGPPR